MSSECRRRPSTVACIRSQSRRSTSSRGSGCRSFRSTQGAPQALQLDVQESPQVAAAFPVQDGPECCRTTPGRSSSPRGPSRARRGPMRTLPARHEPRLSASANQFLSRAEIISVGVACRGARRSVCSIARTWSSTRAAHDLAAQTRGLLAGGEPVNVAPQSQALADRVEKRA